MFQMGGLAGRKWLQCHLFTDTPSQASVSMATGPLSFRKHSSRMCSPSTPRKHLLSGSSLCWADQRQIKVTVFGLTEEAVGSLADAQPPVLHESMLLCRIQRVSVHLLALLCRSGRHPSMYLICRETSWKARGRILFVSQV